MIRRRRAPKEIPFGFDSFLDVVANVVGIIIRLILVVWVGARSYHTLQHQLRASPPKPPPPVEASVPDDPLRTEIAQRQRELEEAQRLLLDELRRLNVARQADAQARQQLGVLTAGKQALEQEQAQLASAVRQRQAAVQSAALSLAELRDRGRRLADEILELQKRPAAQKALTHRTPISRPVQSEELFFECRGGRVTFIDIQALLNEVRQGLEAKGQLLKSQWEVHDTVGPVGAFRLRYSLERERGPLDALVGGIPEANSNFRYGLSRWDLEPIALVRGEPLTAALADGSEFRQVIDGMDPQAVVTLWVYPDSFELFRRLRDYLYDRDVVVAGRPLPDGVAIASSRQGTVSRGQ
jgi:hypothetical protein